MAITSIHPIDATLEKSIGYITKDEKTNGGELVSAYACSGISEKATEQFLRTISQRTAKGKLKILAQHIHQSFEGMEVTPEQAHQIGIELADKFLQGKYQYVVATHVDTDNIHNHIIFNNVSFETRKSFESEQNRNKKSWKNLRKISDEICKEHGISIIEKPMEKGKCYYEWQKEKQGTSWKSKLRNIIDETIQESRDFDDLLRRLREKKVECVYTPQNKIKIKFRMPGQERFARGRTLGWYYDEPQLRKRIEQYRQVTAGKSGYKPRTKIIDTDKEIFQNSPGLLHWAEIQNMKEASKKINYLTTHGIDKKSLNEQSILIYNQRTALINELTKTQKQIENLGDNIKLLRAYEKQKIAYYSSRGTKNNAEIFKKYHSILKKLKEGFPDENYPDVKILEQERTELLAEFKELNKKYDDISSELKAVENAKQTLDEYVKKVKSEQKNHSER